MIEMEVTVPHTPPHHGKASNAARFSSSLFLPLGWFRVRQRQDSRSGLVRLVLTPSERFPLAVSGPGSGTFGARSGWEQVVRIAWDSMVSPFVSHPSA